MYRYIFKSLKVGFWILVPLLFISNAAVVPTELIDDSKGSYYLRAKGAIEGSLQGEVFFETLTESTNEGVPYSTLSLEFLNQKPMDSHSIKILISKHGQLQLFKAGKYNVSENIEGFLNSFDGVFGYVNIGALSEQPFFSNRGTVVFKQITKNDLQGNINVAFMSNSGEKIIVKGDFHAVKGH